MAEKSLIPWIAVIFLAIALVALVDWEYQKVNATKFVKEMGNNMYSKATRYKKTTRIGCRELETGQQSCVFRGPVCIDVNQNRTSEKREPVVYFVDDSREDNEEVESDNHCFVRHMSADPFYWGSRYWPPREDLIAPRGSCLFAHWRKTKSLFNKSESPRVKWLEDISLLNFDLPTSDHNMHFLMDTIWLLDVVLWEKSITGTKFTDNSSTPRIFKKPNNLFFPLGSQAFRDQMNRDMNRFMFAILLGLNPKKLYSNQIVRRSGPLETSQIFDAYPKLEDRIFFNHDEKEKDYDLLCTRRFQVGAKTANMGSRRVCKHFRRLGWELFGLKPPEIKVSDYLHYERPPKRVILLDRHVNRKIRNKDELVHALKNASIEHGFELEVNTTAQINTAEDHVLFYRRAGVLVTPHGSHSMGAIWMPRFSSIIEIMPPYYMDSTITYLAEGCNLRYYRLFAKVPEDLRQEFEEKCNTESSFYYVCVPMKTNDIVVNPTEIVDKVLHSIRQLGY